MSHEPHPLQDVLDRIQADPRYQSNLDWGRPRSGHPEGTIRRHVEDLERNLARLQARLTEDEFWKVRVLVHVHDSFKPDAQPGVRIDDPRSHASLAAAFLVEFCDDPDLPAMAQWHDEPYALWRKSRRKGLDQRRFAQLLENVRDWDTFVAFLLVDGCVEGKSRAPLEWLLSQLEGRVSCRFHLHDLDG